MSKQLCEMAGDTQLSACCYVAVALLDTGCNTNALYFFIPDVETFCFVSHMMGWADFASGCEDFVDFFQSSSRIPCCSDLILFFALPF